MPDSSEDGKSMCQHKSCCHDGNVSSTCTLPRHITGKENVRFCFQ